MNRIAITLTAAALSACVARTAPAPAERFDVILRGGTILDGTGKPAYRADVGVIGGHIAAIGDLSRATATTDLDVRGLHVAPGFINIHSHPSALSIAENMLRQGVTTEIMNPDGGGDLDVGRRLAAAESASLAVNIGAYAPFNTAWQRVVGNADRRPTAAEIGQMTSLLDAALQAGAWGVSAGLDYKPAYFATTDEVVAVLTPVRRWRTNFPNHDRLKPEWGYSSLAAIRETIEIGERAGLVPVITHMKLQGIEQGRADSALSMMKSATARGVYTAADVYPYLAGQTSLSALFIPGWAQDGGRPALLERLRDSVARARIVRETQEALAARVGTAANIYLPSRRMTVEQLMPTLGATSPGEAIARILEQNEETMLATFGAEPDVVKIIQYPDAAIACDCGASRGGAHPRGYGSFPRVLGPYSRETGALTLADAVRKMTGLPATIIGMVDRGFIAVGMAADVTVFDSARVIDRATYERPTEWSEGIRHVLVNGRLALREGAPTGTTAGRALRRTPNMPSRPMSRSSNSIRVSGSGVTIDLSQAATDRSARGQVRFSKEGTGLEAVQVGVLQTTRDWASITGRVRTANGDVRVFSMIVDQADPGAPRRTVVILRMDGQPEIRSELPFGALVTLGQNTRRSSGGF